MIARLCSCRSESGNISSYCTKYFWKIIKFFLRERTAELHEVYLTEWIAQDFLFVLVRRMR